MSWTAVFPEPIPLPGGKSLKTLRDAGKFIEKLPEDEVSRPAWQNALHVVLQAADDHGPIDFARIGMMKALYPREPARNSTRKDSPWRSTRKLMRDR